MKLPIQKKWFLILIVPMFLWVTAFFVLWFLGGFNEASYHVKYQDGSGWEEEFDFRAKIFITTVTSFLLVCLVVVSTALILKRDVWWPRDRR